MKVAVLNCSPKGETSLTAITAKFLDKMFPDDEFAFMFVGDGKLSEEEMDMCKGCDLLLITSSIYHCSVHAQMIRMLDNLAKEVGEGKPVTYLTTSNMFYEIGAHDYIKAWATRNKLYYIRSLGLYDVSILSDKGKEELFRWFSYVKDWIALRNNPHFEKQRNIVILDGSDPDDVNASKNRRIAHTLQHIYEDAGCGSAEVIALKDYDIKPCKACLLCYTDRVCVMRDDFEKLFERAMLGTDILIAVGTLRYGLLGETFKKFTDRQVQFGRCFLNDEVIKGYVYSVCDDTLPSDEVDAHHHELALDSIAHSYYAGTIKGFDEVLEEEALRTFAADTIHIANNELFTPTNCYEKSLNQNFADLAVQLRSMTPLDYAEYAEAGYYVPLEKNPFVRAISKKGGTNPSKMRLMEYAEQYQNFTGKLPLTERRRFKNTSILERKRSVKPITDEQAAVFSGQKTTKKSRRKGLLFRKKEC